MSSRTSWYVLLSSLTSKLSWHKDSLCLCSQTVHLIPDFVYFLSWSQLGDKKFLLIFPLRITHILISFLRWNWSGHCLPISMLIWILSPCRQTVGFVYSYAHKTWHRAYCHMHIVGSQLQREDINTLKGSIKAYNLIN
jgi:hypothetical protein